MAGLTVEQDLRVRSALADLHDACFTRDMKVTLVARHPTEAERHLVCGDDDLAEVVKLVAGKISLPPLDIVLPCPKCGTPHIDAPEPEHGWDNPPHRSHLCHKCGCVWRPADVPTNGVAAARTRGEKDTYPAKREVNTDG